MAGGGKKVVHVQLKEPRDGQKEHHYFGSLSAIYTELTPEDVGRTYESVKGMSIEKKLGGFLETKKSIIRIGEIVRKAGNRARKKD